MGRVIHCQGVQMQGQLFDVFARLQLTVGKSHQQAGDQRQRLLQTGQRRSPHFDAALKDPIEQVLGRPGQLRQALRGDHPPAALEGVQAPTQFYQGVAVGSVGLPARPLLIELRQELISLFEEHLAQLVINHRLLDNRRLDLHHFRFGFGLRLRHITQRRQAGLGGIEKLPGIGLWISEQPLQIALTGAQGIGQVRQCCGIRWRRAEQVTLGIVGTLANQSSRTGQHQHGQGAADLLQQVRQYQ
ncbi:hypothetical protein D3C81_536340 [compost metagenome]